MIFSPDDFDTSGLELVPTEGEEPTNPLDGYTAEQQVADAEVYSVVEKPVTATEVVDEAEPAVVEGGAGEVSTESEPTANLEEFRTLGEVHKDEQAVLKGELAIAISSGDIETVRTVNQKLLESEIKSYENDSQVLTADFEGGDFQHRISQPEGKSGQALLDHVKGVYEYQLGDKLYQITWLKKRLAESQVPDLPADFVSDVIRREQLSVEFGNGIQQQVFDQINKAKEVAEWEKKAGPGSYGNYTKELEGALGAALKQQQKQPNSNLVQAMKSASRNFANKLPATLIQQIDSL